jgi:multicomponent Na+:H+ antiporter subunit B
MTTIATIALLVLLIVTAAGAIWIRDLIGAVLVLGSYGFVLAILWASLGAVDVAFMEAVVGAGLSTVFFLLTLFQTDTLKRDAERQNPYPPWQGLLGLCVLGGILLFTAADFPMLGDPNSPPNIHLSPTYLKQSLVDTNTPNVVASILMDYRAFDTLVETAMIFSAGIAAALLLWRKTS